MVFNKNQEKNREGAVRERKMKKKKTWKGIPCAVHLYLLLSLFSPLHSFSFFLFLFSIKETKEGINGVRGDEGTSTNSSVDSSRTRWRSGHGGPRFTLVQVSAGVPFLVRLSEHVDGSLGISLVGHLAGVTSTTLHLQTTFASTNHLKNQ